MHYSRAAPAHEYLRYDAYELEQRCPRMHGLLVFASLRRGNKLSSSGNIPFGNLSYMNTCIDLYSFSLMMGYGLRRVSNNRVLVLTDQCLPVYFRSPFHVLKALSSYLGLHS
jgi:hypothetical protein